MSNSSEINFLQLGSIAETELFFQSTLLLWYEQHKRNLPWRHFPDPYRVWLSEIILQQTRVDQGLPYYERFVSAYPDLKSFSQASEEAILKLWQGLGYYSRARNMLSAAAQIMNEYGGRFPITAIELKSLKGIGDYTAAAISSHCFNEHVAVVDGNVYRVLSRYYGIDTAINESSGRKLFAELAQLLLPLGQAATYNQAIMDFGALQCKPAPDCSICPLITYCVAFADNRVKSLPLKSGKTKVRLRYFQYLVVSFSGTVFLLKRGNCDIWQGLFDFPLIETSLESDITSLLTSEMLTELMRDNTFTLNSRGSTFKHMLSHQVIYATFWEFTLDQQAGVAFDKFTAVKFSDFSVHAVSRLAQRYLESKQHEI